MALKDVERLICCSKTTVQAFSADTFINALLTYPFGDDFNCPIKSRTKYILKDLKKAWNDFAPAPPPSP